MPRGSGHPLAGSQGSLPAAQPMECSRSSRSQLRLFVWLAFGASWGIGGVALLIDLWLADARALTTSSPLYYLAAYSISGVGVLLTGYFFGADGLRGLGRRLVPRPSDAWAYLAVMVTYAAITGIAISTAHGIASVARLPWLGFGAHLPLALVRDPGPLGEEFGWRGFALPRLVDSTSPLGASLRLGLVHTLWHLPLFLVPGMPQAQVSFPAFAVGVMAIAAIDTVLYLRTASSLSLAILVHLLANACGDLAQANGALTAFLLFEGLVALALIALGTLTALPVIRQLGRSYDP